MRAWRASSCCTRKASASAAAWAAAWAAAASAAAFCCAELSLNMLANNAPTRAPATIPLTSWLKLARIWAAVGCDGAVRVYVVRFVDWLDERSTLVPVNSSSCPRADLLLKPVSNLEFLPRRSSSWPPKGSPERPACARPEAGRSTTARAIARTPRPVVEMHGAMGVKPV